MVLHDICYEWEERTDMKLGFNYIKEIWQKDVNNYVFVDYEGNVERKGAYVKELSPMDNDLPIINKALVDRMLKGVPVEDTINNCDRLIDFQKICKLSSKFDFVQHSIYRELPELSDVTTYNNKCFRVFASTSPNDGIVQKVKEISPGCFNSFKFANTSEHSFIENGDITTARVPAKLNRSWYIDLANERLKQYGVA